MPSGGGIHAIKRADRIPEGPLDKRIADGPGIDMRTVEVHRSRVLQKTGARNSVELAQMKARIAGG